MTTCIYCINEPSSHSFSNTDYVLINNVKIKKYYTKVADAKLFDKPETIIYHMEQEFNKNNDIENSELYIEDWIWDINFDNASIKHYLSINTVIKLCKWLKNSNYGKKLKKINIYNSGLLGSSLIIIAKLYLPENIEIINH
jgi:hypothetical protein